MNIPGNKADNNISNNNINNANNIIIKFIKVKKGYYETNVSEKKIIKETVKVTEDKIYNEDEEKIKLPPNEEQNKVFCGGCVIN